MASWRSWIRRRLVQRRIAKQGDNHLHSRSKAMENPSQTRQAPLQASICIEIMFGRLKDWRRVATRYERCPKVFLSVIALAVVVIVQVVKPDLKRTAWHPLQI
ncbi:transposase [Donghicola sp. C2-DW-16]|uniref:Transposase n=1 Tax=Donghicola mangrovi TaxID=2729614 RepID=A0ABX2PJX6_9RHOB|nr:transposase [Donghicola mangrovi]